MKLYNFWGRGNLSLAWRYPGVSSLARAILLKHRFVLHWALRATRHPAPSLGPSISLGRERPLSIRCAAAVTEEAAFGTKLISFPWIVQYYGCLPL